MVLSMERWVGKVAVVTGTSAGIGVAIAKALVNEGVKVVGLARRVEKVEELAKKLEGKKGKLYPFKADVTKEEDVLAVFKWVKENLGPVHILVNNAGIVISDRLIDGKTEDWKKVLDTNVLGLCVCTREAVKSMRENGVDGHVIHISSIAGHKVVPVPKLNVYFASKFAVTALTETLRQELNSIGSRTKITSISPGTTVSEIRDAGSLEQGKGLLPPKLLEEEDIADGVIYVLSTPPHVQVHELTIKPVLEPF